ncbi:hypothetical protein F5I97DRAFT_1925442 [Phlebopus sp. FC_14]|nr:hypothetical protein F5I97DRAFT_1925442 [Phlebopus sp. FC_14]
MTGRYAIGQRIRDPRVLSDELESSDDRPRTSANLDQSSALSASHASTIHDNLYSNLATFTFGDVRVSQHTSLSRAPYDAAVAVDEFVSPLTPMIRRSSPDHTPRPSVSVPAATASPSRIQHDCSHPSQGAEFSPSTSLVSLHHSYSPTSGSRDTSSKPNISRPPSLVDRESEESASSTLNDHSINTHQLHSDHLQRGRVMPDNFSQHTFGPNAQHHDGVGEGAEPSSSVSATSSSRSSSRSRASAGMCIEQELEQFSSDDEVEIGDFGGESSPVTFARDYLLDIDEDVDVDDPWPSFYRTSIFDGRKASLPMAIPGAVPGGNATSREGSILTLRRPSRSLDDSGSHLSGGEDPIAVVPKSEPLSRADWRSLEAQAQQQQQQATDSGNPYEGLDLAYILSRKSEGSIRSFGSSAYAFGQSGSRMTQSDAGSSRFSSIAPFAVGARRTSTITLQTNYSNDDAFLRHIRKNDVGYGTVEERWAFVREKADGVGMVSSKTSSTRHGRPSTSHSRISPSDNSKRTMAPGEQELWRCGHVGRFRVERSIFHHPAKASQHRLNIHHIPDPFLKGNGTHGPHTMIHKHTRTVAFSIFRSYTLHPRNRRGSAQRRNTHMNTRNAIMLATKRVQEQYTSTRTTSKLSTHGLLNDRPKSSRTKDKDKNKALKTPSKGNKGKDRDRDKDKDKREKQKERTNPTGSAGSSKATSSAGSVNAGQQSTAVSTVDASSPSQSSQTTVGKREEHSLVSALQPLPPANDPVKLGVDTTFGPPIRYHREHRDSIDSDIRLPTRTPHAEAFGALDPNDIEHYRLKANSRANAESNTSFTERISRMFRSPRLDGLSASPAMQAGAFQPPWILTAGRKFQEENDRVINNLNNSFRDVGLLHTQPHKHSSRGTSKRKSQQEVLDDVPDDSLYMLLPLWPGETAISSGQAQEDDGPSFMPQNRRYLLVYYMPFDDPKGKKPEQPKKKSKQLHSSDGNGSQEPKPIFLPAFRVVARIVTYRDLRLSGVRVPSEGLAITGPAWEAMSYLGPPAPQQGPALDDMVVCVCHGRDRGFVFLPEGLARLGLCTVEEPPPQHVPRPEEEEVESEILLTPIGRAVVEMIWLGCLAMTSFGSD